jgi:hypothetical protein
LGRLVGEHDLAAKLAAFRDGHANAEEVAWAFVQARVEAHSPTFSWEEADRGRLLGLVVDCSREPVFESAEPEAVARTLVAAQDKEREQLRELAQMFSRTFANAANLKGLLPSSYRGWAEQQGRSFEAIQRSLGFGDITKQMLGVSKAVGVAQQMSGLGFAGQVARQMEEQQRMLARAAMPLQAPMLGATFNLRNTPLLELSRSLQQTMEALQIRPLKLPPDVFLNRETITVDEMLEVAEEAVDVMAERRAGEQVEELRAVTQEVRKAAENPSPARFEEMMANLTERIEEESRKRSRDQLDALVLNVLLFLLQVCLAYFFWRLEVPPPGR